jgi:hypothetical protein
VIKNILQEGMDKKIFRTVDPELTIASVIGTINHVMSTSAFLKLIPEATGDTVNNEKLCNRLTSHLQQMIQAHLLNH